MASTYQGTQRKVVFAFDIGTTFSGITYAILDPGRKPEVKSVTKFPEGAEVGGDTKVPTVIYYDPNGSLRAIGEETKREGIDILAEESNWTKAEWFKLHLRPKTQTSASVSDDIPPLPAGKTAVDLFSDFLKYMDQSAKTYFGEHHITPLSSGRVEYVLSHPNAWEGAQQMLMRKAAVQAGLIADTPEDHSKVSFITEGEASLSCCVDKGLINDSIKEGEGVVIVDAGGGTIDICTYARRGNSDEEGYEEISPSQSFFRGSVFVTKAASRYLVERFGESQFSDDIAFMTERFNKATKLQFRDPSDPSYIKFGTVRDHAPTLGITKGRLRLDGNTVADFFEPSIQCIVDAVVDQQQQASRKTRTAFLVGGFAASDYLYAQLRERLQLYQIDVFRPDTHLGKAVPDGAIAGYLRPVIHSRMAKFTYGIRSNIIYNAAKPEHQTRSSQRFTLLCGESRLPGGFWTILKKNTKVSDTQEFRSTFFLEGSSKAEFVRVKKTGITCYRGNLLSPEFLNEDPENFHETFQIRADLSKAIDQLKPQHRKKKKVYYKLSYDIIISFGSTEFKAQFAWKENGVEKRGPAEILYDAELEYPV